MSNYNAYNAPNNSDAELSKSRHDRPQAAVAKPAKMSDEAPKHKGILRGLLDFAVKDVLIPEAKKAVMEIGTNGLDMLLYGGEPHKGSSHRSGSKISYQQYYEDNNRRNRGSIARTAAEEPVSDFEKVRFETRGDAEAVLDRMYDILSNYGMVSIMDFFDLAQVTTEKYTLANYGWRTLSGSEVKLVGDGYAIIFGRRPERLKS